jgi:hypothetical protein
MTGDEGERGDGGKDGVPRPLGSPRSKLLGHQPRL